MVMMRYVLCILALLLSCACVHVLAEEVPAADLSDQVPDTESETKILLQGIEQTVNQDTQCTTDGGSGSNCTAGGTHVVLEETPQCADGTVLSYDRKSCVTKPEVPPAKVPEVPKNVDSSHPRGEEGLLRETTLHTMSTDPGSEQKATESEPAVTQPSESESGESHPGRISDSTSTTERQGEESTADKQSNEEVSSNTTVNSTPADSNPNQHSPEAAGATAAPDSQETNSSTPQSTESNVTEAPTTTPSPVPVTDTQISSVASTVQKNKVNADSSVSPVWMRTAAPLLIVVVLFSFTVY
ncbi:uncharacterized protein TM35_000431020 [Trypanosoma theileri]|uniref:Complement component 3 CUB domain-containing protein n=1 Tax=Trypanosoma theileri TaxID=67003 RepID=A0A1X0NIE8_9TRYP|nr:uncharacterized protein TM35_000431020 [Trypanosoma theileri]ORC84534.1 hypothetical protein TM35_000431020 [Trypanosoma theileri]